LRTFSDAYVIMLSGLDTETDRVVGLSVGADDYMAKPFSTRELVARIRAMQRRPRGTAGGLGVRRFGALEIDPGAHKVTVEGKVVDLSHTEFDLLDALAAQPRISLSRRQLLESIWGASWLGDDHVIDVHMSNLRRKLGDRDYIKTVRGFGYRMAEF
jgi:DNA-binding response OmpR family regulator